MKKHLLISMFIGCLLYIGCGENEVVNPIKKMNDEELLSSGWSEFEKGNYTNSKEYFLELIERQDKFIKEAYAGLGWSESHLNLYINAINSFNSALEYLDVNDDISNDIYAGLSFANDALDKHHDCLNTTKNVDENWHFSHDTKLDYNDIILLKAISYYALGCKENESYFSNCLEEVQRLDPGYSINVSTIGGRGQLSVKIEELKSSLSD